METNELKRILEAYDAKLEHSITLNREALKSMHLEKSAKKTRNILIYRSIELLFFGIVVIFLGNYVVSHWAHTHLAIGGCIVGGFALIALIGSIGQVALLQQIDFSKPLVDIRKKIELVNSHNLLFIKLVFLSAPVWWSYALVALDVFLGFDLYPHLEQDFVVRYLIFNAILIIPVIWLFNKLTYKNIHITWVRKTIGFLSGTKTRKAMEFLNEIEEFEN